MKIKDIEMKIKDYPFLSIKACGQKVIEAHLTKRNSYPRTFSIKKKNFSILGYIEPKLYSDLKNCLVSEKKISQFLSKIKRTRDKEFLLIILKEKPFEIKVYRDAFCTLPIFYMQKDDSFFLSNEFIELFSYLSKDDEIDIDFKHLSEHLLFKEGLSNKTIFSEIKVLTERSILTGNDKGVKIKYPNSSLILTKPSKLKNSLKSFTKILEKTLDNYWFKFREKKNIGFEVSGGVDSVTPIKFYSQIAKDRLKGFSMVFDGELGAGQKRKLREIARFSSIKIDFTPIVNLWPLKSQAKSKKLKPFFLKREIYFEALDKMAQKAQKQGVKVIITGTGGDEAFAIDPREKVGFQGSQEKKFRESFIISSIFTDKVRQGFLSPDEDVIPIPVIPYSVLSSNSSRNNIYIRHNIWPVAPLAHPIFARFCRHLPKNKKEKKKILRDYLKKLGYSEEIYNPQRNENFASFFDNTICRKEIKDLFRKLISSSQLSKLGIIDKDEFIKVYTEYCQKKSKISPLYFYTIITTEILLQSCNQ